MKYWMYLFTLIAMMSVSRLALADDPKIITSATCTDVKFEDIPVGDFKWPMTMPESDMRITQGYNTLKKNGYCNAGGGQPPASSDACIGKQIYYGHDGIDIHAQGAADGTSSVFATQDALVVASHMVGTRNGWGDSMFLAVRANTYSDQILTLHFHHLHQTGSLSTGNYTTSRLYNACELVERGAEIAHEGTSGTHAVHLHYTIRRWDNFKELQAALKNNGHGLYTHGYSFGANSKLEPLLDPQGMLYDQYSDFQPDADGNIPDAYAMPYALNMRHHGIEFGLYDGNFGRTQNVTRREAARWIKIAADRYDDVPGASTFPDDVPLKDKDSPYIEALTHYPATVSVVNPIATCQVGKKKFCPDNNITRAEVLKMIVLAFYDQQFLAMYDNLVWRSSYIAAMDLLTSYEDVDPLSWYAPYIYFGTTMDLVTDQQFFRPNDPVTRAEMAKWVMIGYDLKHDTDPSPCNGVNCMQGFYCNPQSISCEQISSCVPTETQECEVGGGYDPCENDPACGGACIPNSTTSCGMCGVQTCNSSGEWGTCIGQGTCNPGYIWSETCNTSGTRTRVCQNNCQPGTWSQCSTPDPECTPGYVAVGTCPDNTNKYATCDASGHWGPWSSCNSQQQCTPGQTQQQNCGVNGTQSRTCDNTGNWSAWGNCNEQQNCTCNAGECCDGCNYLPSSTACDLWYNYQCAGNNPGDNAQKAMVKQFCSGSSANCDGQTTQYGWQTQEDCSTSQVCTMQSGVATCSGACQDTYQASSTSACFTNSQSAGSPTLCLEISAMSGSSFNYRVCKQTGTYSNAFSYQLKDDNNLINFTTYTGSSGVSCTPWKTENVNYISGYGTINGAGLHAEVISPQGCSQSTCKYKTGTVTISKTCQ